MMKINAAIDLGTNTARLLIGEYKDGVIAPLLIDKEIIRLGGGFTKTSGISDEAFQRAVPTLKRFAHLAKSYKCSSLRGVATSAVREAVNSQVFLETVYNDSGIQLEVISGEEEGSLTLEGVKQGIKAYSDYQFVFDLGGGSTEFTVAHNFESLFTISLPLGVVRLCEDQNKIDKMRNHIYNHLFKLKRLLSDKGVLQFLKNSTLAATAGTATTLAAVKMKMSEYDYKKINGYIISKRDIQEIFENMLLLAPEERLALPGMEKGREDLLIPGILVTVMVMELFEFSCLTVSDYGLLEGVFLSTFKN